MAESTSRPGAVKSIDRIVDRLDSQGKALNNIVEKASRKGINNFEKEINKASFDGLYNKADKLGEKMKEAGKAFKPDTKALKDDLKKAFKSVIDEYINGEAQIDRINEKSIKKLAEARKKYALAGGNPDSLRLDLSNQQNEKWNDVADIKYKDRKKNRVSREAYEAEIKKYKNGVNLRDFTRELSLESIEIQQADADIKEFTKDFESSINRVTIAARNADLNGIVGEDLIENLEKARNGVSELLEEYGKNPSAFDSQALIKKMKEAQDAQDALIERYNANIKEIGNNSKESPIEIRAKEINEQLGKLEKEARDVMASTNKLLNEPIAEGKDKKYYDDKLNAIADIIKRIKDLDSAIKSLDTGEHVEFNNRVDNVGFAIATTEAFAENKKAEINKAYEAINDTIEDKEKKLNEEAKRRSAEFTQKALQNVNYDKYLKPGASGYGLLQKYVDEAKKGSNTIDEIYADFEKALEKHIKDIQEIEEEQNGNYKQEESQNDSVAQSIDRQNRSLEEKLEYLKEIRKESKFMLTAQDDLLDMEDKAWDVGGNNPKSEADSLRKIQKYEEQEEHIERATAALNEFDETYEKVILTLKNGEKIEILDSGGLLDDITLAKNKIKDITFISILDEEEHVKEAIIEDQNEVQEKTNDGIKKSKRQLTQELKTAYEEASKYLSNEIEEENRARNEQLPSDDENEALKKKNELLDEEQEKVETGTEQEKNDFRSLNSLLKDGLVSTLEDKNKLIGEESEKVKVSIASEEADFERLRQKIEEVNGALKNKNGLIGGGASSNNTNNDSNSENTTTSTSSSSKAVNTVAREMQAWKYVNGLYDEQERHLNRIKDLQLQKLKLDKDDAITQEKIANIDAEIEEKNKRIRAIRREIFESGATQSGRMEELNRLEGLNNEEVKRAEAAKKVVELEEEREVTLKANEKALKDADAAAQRYETNLKKIYNLRKSNIGKDTSSVGYEEKEKQIADLNKKNADILSEYPSIYDQIVDKIGEYYDLLNKVREEQEKLKNASMEMSEANSLYDKIIANLVEKNKLEKENISLRAKGSNRISDENEAKILNLDEERQTLEQKITESKGRQAERDLEIANLTDRLNESLRIIQLKSDFDLFNKSRESLNSILNKIDKIQSRGKGGPEGQVQVEAANLKSDISTFLKSDINPSDTSIKTITEQVDLLINRFKELEVAEKNAFTPLSDDSKTKALLKLDKFVQQNTAMGRDFEKRFSKLRLQIDAAKSVEELKVLTAQLNKLESELIQTGRTGKSVFANLSNRIKQMSTNFIAMYFSFYDIYRYVTQAIGAIQDLDTALVDLRKTTTMTNSDLEKFYYNSNEIAKQTGVTTQEIISQAAAWSRLGYSSKDAAEQMAALSSQFAQISPGMDVEKATDGLVSVMKGFGISVNDVEKEIMDAVNRTGNTMATSNEEIVEMLERSSAAMSAANNTLAETIALESAAVQITRNAETTGTAFRTISMRIRGIDEETEELSEGLENISGDIADLTKTAKTPGGISLFTDQTKSEYKSTYQILKEIAAIYHDISDKQQAEILEKLAGKRGGQVLAGLLNDFSEVERAMGEIENSAGSADAEMTIIEDSIEYKINQLKQTWIGTLQALADRKDLGQIIDFLTALSEAIGKVVDSLGLLGTAATGVGLYTAIKSFKQISLSDNVTEAMELAKAYKAVSVNVDAYLAQGGRLTDEAQMTAILTQATKGLNVETAVLAMSKRGITYETIKQVLGEELLNTEEGKNALIKAGLITETGGLILENKALNLTLEEQIAVYGALNKQALASLGARLLSLINPTTLLIAGIVGIGAALVKLTDIFNVSIEEAKELEEASASALESTRNDIDTMSQELESINERIKEINEQDSISVTDEEELRRLETQNQLLEAQLKSKEKLAEYQEIGLTRNSAQALTATDPWYKHFWNNSGLNIVDNSKNNLRRIRADEKERQRLLEQQAALNPKDANYESSYRTLQNQIDKLDDSINENTQTLTSDYEDILSYYNNLLDKNGEAKAGFEDEVASVKELIDMMTGWLNTSGYVSSIMDIVNPEEKPVWEMDDAQILQYIQLADYTKDFTEKEKEAWTVATKGAKNSTEAIKLYEAACLRAIASLEEIEKESKDAFEPSTISGAVDNLDRKLSSQLSTLGDVYDKIFNGDNGFTLDVDTVGMEELNSVRDAFVDLGEDIGFTFEDAEKHVDDFLKVISDSGSKQGDVQKAFNGLVTAYLDAAGAMDDVNEETKESIIRGLESMGVTNARTRVEEELAAREIATSIATEVANGAAAWQTAEMINQAAATDTARLAAANMVLEQIKLNSNQLDFSTSIAQIKSITAEYLDGAAAASIFNQAQAASSLFEAGGQYALLSGDEKAKMQQKITENMASRTKQAIIDEFSSVGGYEFAGDGGGNSTSSGSGGGGGGSDKSSEKEKDRFYEQYDWIEKRLDRLQRLIDKFGQKASSVWRTWTDRSKALNKEINKTKTLIKDTKEAAERYEKYANNVVKTAKKDNVKALNSKGEEDENGKIKRVKLKKGQYYYINDQGQKQALSEKQYKEYQRLTKLIEKGRIGKGDIEAIKDETLRNAVSEYEEYWQKSVDAQKQYLEAQDQIAQEYQQKFDNLVSKYDQKLSRLEYRSNILSEHISQFEALGLEATQEHIRQNKELVQSEKDMYEKEIDALRRERDRQVEQGYIKEGSEQWENYNDKIRECKVSLEQCNTEMAQLNKQSRELASQRFDYLIGKINNLADESQFIVDTLSRKSLINSIDQYTTSQLKNDHSNFQGIGKLTDAGMATLGQYGIQYNVYAEELVKLNQRRQELLADISKEPWNSDLIDELDELDSKTRQTSTSMQGAIQSIVDLMKEAVAEEIKGLEKLTDFYKSSLDAQQELYNYNKTIKEQTTDITSLQKQLSAYRGDNSVENQSRLQTLNKQLIDAQKKLQETETEHLISEQKKMLDNLVTEYSDTLNAKFNDTDAVLIEAIEMINQNADTVSKETRAASEANGVAISDAMSKIIPDARDTWINDGELVATYGPKDFSADFRSDTTNKLQTTNTNIEKLADGDSAVSRAVNDVTTAVNNRIEYAEKIAEISTTLDSILDAINNLSFGDNSKLESLLAQKEKYQKQLEDKYKLFWNASAAGDTKKANQYKYEYQLTEIKLAEIEAEIAKLQNAQSNEINVYYDPTPTTSSGYTTNAPNGSAYYTGSASHPNGIVGKDENGKPVTYAELADNINKLKAAQKAKNKKKKNKAHGVHNNPYDELVWTNEYADKVGGEAIIRKKDGAILTPLNRGDSVLTAAQTENLFNLAKMPLTDIKNNLLKAGTTAAVSNVNASTSVGDVSFTVTLPNVNDYSSFKREMQNDKQFEKFIRSISTDQVFGASRLKKYSVR